MNIPKKILDVKNLTILFGGLVAVDNVNFHIAPGELVGLIGPNGAGKTTCFNMLTGVYQPTSGQIEFDGQSIVGLKPHKIFHRGAARTFQNIRLFKEMSVMDNLLVPLHSRRGYGLLRAILPEIASIGVGTHEEKLRQPVIEVLKILNLEHRASALAGDLPYGEQRKVEIARALVNEPKLLLLDEPAAGMNPQETSELSDFICRVQKDFKTTILLIEHDMSLVMKICERIYVLDYGKLIAEGLPQDIQQNPKVIEAYLGGGLDAV